MDMKLLNLGCGTKKNRDWVNIDLHPKSEGVIAHNLREGIPFPENTFDVVYHSAVLEHLSKEDATPFMAECFRVLKPGGIIRVAVPDLEYIARAYIRECENIQAKVPGSEANHAWMIMEMVDQLTRHDPGGEMGKMLRRKHLPNESFIYSRIGEEGRGFREQALRPASPVNTTSILKRMPLMMRSRIKKMIPPKYREIFRVGRFRLDGEIHQWMYDQYSLARLLASIGFVNTEKQQATTSKFRSWNTYHLDALPNGKTIKPDLLFMEAVKPTP